MNQFDYMVLCLKYAARMTSSVDPDHTTPLATAWFGTCSLSDYLLSMTIKCGGTSRKCKSPLGLNSWNIVLFFQAFNIQCTVKCD